MLSTQTLGNIRTAAFGVSGLICAAFAALTMVSPSTAILLTWVPIAAALGLALAFFVAALLAGPRNADAALDESYRADGSRAAALGFWAGLVIGTTLWLTGLGGNMQLAITLTGASAVYMLSHAALDLRGRL